MSPEPAALQFPPAFRLAPAAGDHHVFSHLPMHSQQAKLPYLMIPIGGIQMVQARHGSHPTTTNHHHPSSPTSPLSPLASANLSWGWTPRTQGLRTPGHPWPAASQGEGTGRPAGGGQ